MRVVFHVTFIIQEASSEVCKKFNQKPGTWEVLDAGLRWCWAKDEADAVSQARGILASDMPITDTYLYKGD